jgi:AAA domain/Protein of unknown function (DUF4011)/REase_MTES_1575
MAADFQTFLDLALDRDYQVDDVLAACRPLFKQVLMWHESGLVAPLNGLSGLGLDAQQNLCFVKAALTPQHNHSQLFEQQALSQPALQTAAVVSHRVDSDRGHERVDLLVQDSSQVIARPCYRTDYLTWEIGFAHHDAQTDIFSLGMILASALLGLDFTDRAQLARFVAKRDNLFALNQSLPPALTHLIVLMTQLSRHSRPTALAPLITQIDTYRSTVNPAINDAAKETHHSPRQQVQIKLRDRLFDLSRRNRLLYFKATRSVINFTTASLPMVVNISNIKLDTLCVWQSRFAQVCLAGKAINLSSWLQFNDHPYLTSAIDGLIAQARRDKAEYGFSQTRLVIAFLNWHNLKDDSQARIQSPLLLLPVTVSKKKGVRDHYLLEVDGTEAEVNPALRYALQQAYDLLLPERIDLTEVTVQAFHAQVQALIAASEPAVKLLLIDKPEIDLVHEEAKLRIAQFTKKRAGNLGKGLSLQQYQFSYDKANLEPLGLQLYRDHVAAAAFPLRLAAGGAVQHMAAVAVEQSQLTLQVKSSRASNPYVWDVDLCAVSLCHFNYRKMSLVRDYSQLIEQDAEHAVFDRVLALKPRALASPPIAPLAPDEQWPVVNSDASQQQAVALARGGVDCIIQGPPGTGKSQTITNLIADFAARGQRVLFVCEKRAAIDVVYHRLQQQGLASLCVLIHDSQADKKNFVTDLKIVYEAAINAPPLADQSPQNQRMSLLAAMQTNLHSLSRYEKHMQATPEQIGLPLTDFFQHIAALPRSDKPFDALTAERLPSFAQWHAQHDFIVALQRQVTELTGSPYLAKHPFRHLNQAILLSDSPLSQLHAACNTATQLSTDISQAIKACQLDTHLGQSFAYIVQIIAFAQLEQALPTAALRQILVPDSAEFKQLKKQQAQWRQLEKKQVAAVAINPHWREKLSAADALTAAEQAQAFDQQWYRFINPAWWRLRRVLRQRYDFTQQAIPPSVLSVLQSLNAEYAATAALQAFVADCECQYGQALSPLCGAIEQVMKDPNPLIAELLKSFQQSRPEAHATWVDLAQQTTKLTALQACLEGFFLSPESLPMNHLQQALLELQQEANHLPALRSSLLNLHELPSKLQTALRQVDLPMTELASWIANASLAEIERASPWLKQFDQSQFIKQCEQLTTHGQSVFAANSQAIVALRLAHVRAQIAQSSLLAAQLDSAGKAFKKSYNAGRRELTHEFSKTMRFKAIRELASGDSGRVVRDLKPVWLMSPLSVSDTLPLDTETFDVVIFDEASQIPTEEAVPALYRARQVIVVGDEKQLPPTQFFRSSSDADDLVADSGDAATDPLDADSLLTQAAQNLPATLLSGHYRSRSEWLISFSNHSFYNGLLNTVPDRQRHSEHGKAITISSSEDALSTVDALLSRPISHHFMLKSPYELQRNIGEADYIAALMRQLLLKDTGKSIGIVAFSEAQQGEIEAALERLAQQDPVFADQLEQAWVQEIDGQFAGLFVKNLERVQGDERDIMLLSMCYGPNAQGATLMNFGPINQQGGEKRLNVIFSRAKHHMAVITSMPHTSITNLHNEGAAALKSFLHFAQLCSKGEVQQAQAVLQQKSTAAATPRASSVVLQLAQALTALGYTVDTEVGQSSFRCDLAVRSEDQQSYVLGLLIDTPDRYASTDLLTRWVTQPQLLRQFAWRILPVLSRDWFFYPSAVLQQIQLALPPQVTIPKAQGTNS